MPEAGQRLESRNANSASSSPHPAAISVRNPAMKQTTFVFCIALLSLLGGSDGSSQELQTDTSSGAVVDRDGYYVGVMRVWRPFQDGVGTGLGSDQMEAPQDGDAVSGLSP